MSYYRLDCFGNHCQLLIFTVLGYDRVVSTDVISSCGENTWKLMKFKINMQLLQVSAAQRLYSKEALLLLQKKVNMNEHL